LTIGRNPTCDVVFGPMNARVFRTTTTPTRSLADRRDSRARPVRA